MKSTTHKHPIIISIILALLPIVFLSIAGAAIVISNADDNKAIVIQAIAVAVSVIVGLILAKTPICRYSFSEIGFRPLAKGSVRKVYFFIPMIAIELAQIVMQPVFQMSGFRFIILFVFTLLVGLNEELYYRGLLINVLKQLGAKKAIIIASVLFGIGHAASALSGFSPQYVVLQVLFAFLFGFVAAEFMVITKSILPLIIWHFIHDLIGFIGGDVGETIATSALIILAIQSAILLVTAFLYWKKAVAEDTAV